MENATKALLIAAGVLVGVIIFAIFIYEMTYIASISNEVDETVRHKEILKFNAQFEGYANRDEVSGYLGYKNAIAIQELITLCNYVREWNATNMTSNDKQIAIDIKGEQKNEIMSYINNPAITVDELFKKLTKQDANALASYYVIFTSEGIEYKNESGRISKLTFEIKK